MAKQKKSVKIIKLPISKFIDTGFRNYAIYVLTQRGIPAFEDALTPVQRYILDNSPVSFTKTLSVVGKCIEGGYHHGDSSLSKALSRLARPFANSFQILEGYGFFGTEVSPDAAAARYTSVKLNSNTADILRKYKYLFTKNEDGVNDPFYIDIPLGLVIPVVGIAVGYKSIILPRKLEDIKSYLEGKITKINPYFKDFGGNIKKYNNLPNSWIITSKITLKDKSIEIRELPPIMKYSSILTKLDWLYSKYNNKVKIINNSNTKVNIDIVYLDNNKDEFETIINFIKKTFSIIVNESPVFIKDNKVLVYNTVEEYLNDYKWQLIKLDYKNKEYLKNWVSNELEFNKAKKLFIEFIISKKRTVIEIDEFLKIYSNDIKYRVEGLTSKKFTKDELNKTNETIKELTKELKEKEKAFNEVFNKFKNTIDPTLKRGLSSNSNNESLFNLNDLEEDNGVTIWNGEEEIINIDIDE